jgi:hypothetical protein
MEELEKRMLDSVERYSPEALLKMWMQPATLNADWLQDILRQGRK